MTRKWKVIAAAALVAALGIGAGVAVAGGGDDGGDDAAENERPISNASDRRRAEAAALRHVGEGRVTDTEVGDEESYYEVEVTKADGTQVDVQLDRDFRVVGEEADAPGEDASSDE